jgi:hypothetical protein
MHSQLAALVICVSFLAAGRAAAQSADVTFEVPLNVTNLSSEITKVRLKCELPMSDVLSAARSGEVELPVSGGQVVTTAQVLVTVPASALYSPASIRTQRYTCMLAGYSPALGWGSFEIQSVVRSSTGLSPFNVTAPTTNQQGSTSNPISGTFTWW